MGCAGTFLGFGQVAQVDEAYVRVFLQCAFQSSDAAQIRRSGVALRTAISEKKKKARHKLRQGQRSLLHGQLTVVQNRRKRSRNPSGRTSGAKYHVES